MAAETEATVTKLLTLLNVSAAKSTSKRRRTDLTSSVKLGGAAAQSKLVTAALKPSNDVPAQEKRGSSPVDADEPELSSTADSRDPYIVHFGAQSSRITPAAREAVSSGKWNSKRRKIDHVGRVVELLPESHPVIAPVDIKDAVLSKLQESMSGTASPFSQSILATISNYQDLYISKLPAGSSSEDTRRNIALHLINHVSKKRRNILKTNERMTLASKNEAAEQPSASDIQDQGFTRPSVLILLPLRNSALRWVKALLAALPGHQVDNLGRFESEFSLPPDANDKLASATPGTYPRDHIETFKGNIDDTFRVGIKLTRKNVKLFSDFYTSDIILASPLGLRLSIGKEKSADFLSSIETFVMDQSDVMTMQNWEHVQFVLSNLNELPKEAHDTDFSRVKPWYLDGHAKFLRQSILLSAYETPEIRSVFNSSFVNVAGKLRTEHAWPAVKVPEGISQNFVKFETSNLQQEPDSRFDFFTQTVLPAVQRSAVQSVKTMIFVPSYFDFVRVRKHMKALELSFAVLSEYSSNQDISRARQAFFSGDKAFLIMTERFHFFRRYKIRGVLNLVFYQAPEHPQFYSELLSFPFLDDGVDASDVSVRVMCSSYDCMRLERLAGTKALPGLLQG